MIPSHSFPESTTSRRQQQIRTTSRRQLLAAGGAAALAPALAACTGESAAVRSGADAVTYLTSFGTFGRDAYPFVAKELGFFADANLSVDIEPGVGVNNLPLLADGGAHFAVIDMSTLMVNIGQGNTGYTAIAAIHQLAPQALMSVHPDITTALDLAGKTVALVNGAVGELLWPAYAAQHVGLDPDAVAIVHADFRQLPALLASRSVDAVDQFEMGLPTIEAAVGGREVRVLSYSEVLPDLYGIVLITTAELAAQQPQLCVRFRDALLRGLDHSLAHPGQAGRILADQADAADAEVAAAELEIMGSYSRVTGTPLGGVDEIRVAQSIALLEAIGAVPAGMVAQDVVDFDLAASFPAAARPATGTRRR